MVVKVIGYNRVDYTKEGEPKSFYKFYATDTESSEKVTCGLRAYEVMASTHYAETKLLPGLEESKDFHIGWKDGRSFLYVK